jgi:ribosomal protein L37E
MHAVADGPMKWKCQACGVRSYNHHETCDGCGAEHPPPPPEAEPMREPKAVSDAMDCG